MWHKQVFTVGTITKHIAHMHTDTTLAHTIYYLDPIVMIETLTDQATSLNDYIRLCFFT